MRVVYETMRVAEFTCRHEQFGTPTEINGMPLELETTIRVEYWGDGENPEPQAFCVIEVTDIASWDEGEWRRFDGLPDTPPRRPGIFIAEG